MRTSGILMNISSLPSKFGIGTLGENAYYFIDFLKETKQTYWQILPLCPTGYGDSPYQSFSTYAGNPYFIDFDMLLQDGYLKKTDYKNIKWGNSDSCVDYQMLYKKRGKIYKKIYKNFSQDTPKDYKGFLKDNSFWINDYALFMAIKDAYKGKPFTEWDEDIKTRKRAAIKQWSEKCKESIETYKCLQYLFYKQWEKLKEYANTNGIKIIGDLPIYVAADGADVWANPKEFCLDKNMRPTIVAGCPPDAFSEDGQLWGNPIYNWNYMKKNNYKWWTKRLSHSIKVYDVMRIDHFRGFESYYTIKFGLKNAKIGEWKKGPGIDFFKTIQANIGKMPLIAEDLGFLTDDVRKMLKQSKYPGMKVLQFAFDSREDSDYLPHNYIKNCVVYTGTHDNDTILGWFDTLPKKDKKFCIDYLRLTRREGYNFGMINHAMSSIADTVIITMQDLMGLHSEGRMNIPSTVGDNWKWRATDGYITKEIKDKLLKSTITYRRCKLKGEK